MVEHFLQKFPEKQRARSYHIYIYAAAAKLLQSGPTLCDPIDGSPPGSPVPGILQARTLGCHFLLQCTKVKSESEVAQSCLTLRDPMNCSLPGSSVHGIFQARVLEWVAIDHSTLGRSNTKNCTVSGSITLFLLLFPVFWEVGQRRQWHPTPVLLPGKSHGWRSLVGCSPWGRD